MFHSLGVKISTGDFFLSVSFSRLELETNIQFFFISLHFVYHLNNYVLSVSTEKCFTLNYIEEFVKSKNNLL